jgi:hypothetical protein
MTLQCSACSTSAPVGSRFCAQCGGQVIEAAPKCAGCGTELVASAKFCRSCGVQVGNPAPQSTRSIPLPVPKSVQSAPVNVVLPSTNSKLLWSGVVNVGGVVFFAPHQIIMLSGGSTWSSPTDSNLYALILRLFDEFPILDVPVIALFAFGAWRSLEGRQ